MRVAAAEVERQIQSFKAASKAAGIKLTHQRLEVFREVASSVAHPDADAVFRRVRRRMPTVSLDTVYRSLWLLSDLGLVITLGPRRDSVRFDGNLARHHHYVCTRCGRARDFESAALDALRIPDSVKSYGSVVATYVEVRGICDSCENEHAPRSAHPSLTQTRGGQRRKTWQRRRS